MSHENLPISSPIRPKFGPFPSRIFPFRGIVRCSIQPCVGFVMLSIRIAKTDSLPNCDTAFIFFACRCFHATALFIIGSARRPRGAEPPWIPSRISGSRGSSPSVRRRIGLSKATTRALSPLPGIVLNGDTPSIIGCSRGSIDNRAFVVELSSAFTSLSLSCISKILNPQTNHGSGADTSDRLDLRFTSSPGRWRRISPDPRLRTPRHNSCLSFS